MMPLGSRDAAWSEPHIDRSRVMCRSTMQAPSATAATDDGDARLVTGVADGHTVALTQQRDDPQVQFGVVGRVGAGGVQQDQILRAQHVDRVVDLLQRAHAGGEDRSACPSTRVWRSRASSVRLAEAIL